MAGDARESVFVLGEGGAVQEMDLPLPEPIAQRLAKGALRIVNADGSEIADVEELPVPQPTASKAEWVAYAVRVQGLTVDAADAMTRDDLAELYGRGGVAVVAEEESGEQSGESDESSESGEQSGASGAGDPTIHEDGSVGDSGGATGY